MTRTTSVAAILAVAFVAPMVAGAQPLRLVAEGGKVQAYQGETLLWENRHDRSGFFAEPDALGHLVGPVQAGECVYYSIAGYAYRVKAVDGSVQARAVLPAYATAIEPDRDGVTLTVTSSEAKRTWTRIYRFGPEGHDVPFFLGTNLAGARMTRTAAAGLLIDTLASFPDAPERKPGQDEQAWRRRPEMRPYLEAAIDRLSKLAKRDPTNPWYDYWRGQYLTDLGDDAAARQAFEAALAVDAEYDFELLAMALGLDAISPELGRQAFERGMRFLLQQGYEPELAFGLVTVLAHYGGARSENLDPQRDLERLNELGHRLWDLAPLSEGGIYFYKGLADANRQAGRAAEAVRWEERMAAAMHSRVFGIPNLLAERTGPALNVLLATLLAVLLVVLIKGLRYVDAQKASHGVRRWVSFCSWTRGELLGLLVVYALSLGASGVIFSGLASIGRTAALPIAAVSGSLGHPDALAHFAEYRGRPAGDFVYALALQQAGELDQAAAIYEGLGTPRAKNNLGVILAGRGEAERARTLFEQARATEPGLVEAVHNLGEPSASERVERRKRYGVEGLLLALPTAEIWTDSVRVRIKLGDWFQAFGVVYELSASASETRTVQRAGLLNPASLLLGGYLLIALLAFVGLFVRAPTPAGGRPSAVSRVGWGLGFVVPGTARQLSLLGPPMLALFAFSAFVKYFLVTSGGHATDAIEAVALSSLTAHGIGAMAYSPLQLLVRQTSELWWMILIANLIVVVLLERLWPDPLGPRGRR